MSKIIEITNEKNKNLNKIEKLKSTFLIEELYKKIFKLKDLGYESLTDEEKSFFLKSFGIYDKKDDSFMIRVRITGGRINNIQAKKLAEIAQKYGNDYIDITTRMQIELRYIKSCDLGSVLVELDSVGITTFQTGVDNFRNIVSDPLDGISCDNVLDVYPIIEELQSFFLKNSELMNALPRKFNTAISGSFTNRSNILGHDCSFVLAKKEGVFGFNVYLGGKVGIQALCADIFLRSYEVVDFYKIVVNVYKKYGFRDNRNKNRLYFLIETIGMKSFREVLEFEANRDFSSRGILLNNLEDTILNDGKTILKDKTFALHSIIPAGVFSGSDLLQVADVAQKYGNGELRFSIDQNIYLIGVDEKNIPMALGDEYFKKYKNIDTIYKSGIIACTGIQNCKYGVIEAKENSLKMAEFLEKELPSSNQKLRLYWSSCIKGCGLDAIGDIGFVGTKLKVDGIVHSGVDIFLGGKITKKQKDGKLLLKGVILEDANYIVKYLVEKYFENSFNGESFEDYESRVFSKLSYEKLAKVLKLKLYMDKNSLDFEIDILNIDILEKIEAIIGSLEQKHEQSILEILK